MLTQVQLDEAVKRGIIQPEQLMELVALSTRDQLADERESEKWNPQLTASSDEDLRLVGGGNDLFVTVGIALLFAGALFGLHAFFPSGINTPTVILAVLFWLVAEFVTRQYRMKLSSTVLGLGFMGCVVTLLAAYIGNFIDFAALEDNPILAFSLRPVIGSYGSAFFGGVAALATFYFWRFRVPIMSAVIALSLTGLAFLWTILFFYDGVTGGTVQAPSLADIPDIVGQALYVPIICGVFVFATAVWFDLRDRERFTVWSDCAFWLHVLSAPLLVHPLFILARGQNIVLGEIEAGMSGTVMLVLLIFLLVYIALAIDRRSLLIPTLAYFGGLVVYDMVGTTASATGIPPFALILLVIGLLVIIFGAGWQRIRALIVRPTLPTSVINRLPPIRV